MIINAIAIDDEPLALKLIETYCSKISAIALLATFEDPMEALAFIEKNEVEVAFIDVQMPEINGLDLSKMLDKSIKIIFTTAYANFAVDSYEVGALDYLLKPIALNRFVESVQKLVVLKQAALKKDSQIQEVLYVKTEHKIVKVEWKKLRYIKSMKDYLVLHMENTTIYVLDSFANFSEKLPQEQFIRIHKSYMVNMLHFDSLEKNKVNIAGEQLPIGDRYKTNLVEKLKSLL